MNRSFLSVLGAALVLSFASCGEREANTEAYKSDQPMVNAATGKVTGGPQDTEALRMQSDSIANRMATDLGLDENSRNRAQQIYLTHTVRMRELEQKYTAQVSSANAELNNNVGVSNSAGTQSATGAPLGTEAPGMAEERQTIRQETQESMRGILTPEQFTQYAANADRYEPRR